MEPPPPPPPPPVPLPGMNLLSSLPEHLQDEILRRLDLRDAVRTSALSRAWRRRWESIPGLTLCFPKGTRASVIDRVLRRYTGGPSISCFVSYPNDDQDVDDWLVTLSRRGVESIYIFGGFVGDYDFTLGSAIFSCDRLVSLSLEKCCIPPIPQPGGGGGGGFAGFPVLQKLYLKLAFLADNGERELEAIIRGSPQLRVLVLEEVCTPVNCRIEAPYLHTLQLVDVDGSDFWGFGELPRLQCASIYVRVYGYGHQHNFLEFLAGVSQVQDLRLYLPEEIKVDTIPFIFHNLKSLALVTHFDDMETVLLMFSLLRSSPNLEKLHIEIRFWEQRVENWDILSEEWTDAQWTDGMCANLQVLQINNHNRWLPLSFMKLILSKANFLRTLSVDVCPDSQDDPLNELLNCARASAQAQVLFKVQLEEINFDLPGVF